MDRGSRLVRSWDENAALWTKVVRENGIPSRVAVTDRAIVDAAKRLNPQRVLDVGCGEGWLVRRLMTEIGCAAVGIDGSAELIANAKGLDENGDYFVLPYGTLIDRPDRLNGPYDLAICNFSLLGENISTILDVLRQSLVPGGSILIQTLHPWAVRGEEAYADGWREESFTAFGNWGWQPMPWYFRTLASWLAAVDEADLRLTVCLEPVDPKTRTPVSLILGCAVG